MKNNNKDTQTTLVELEKTLSKEETAKATLMEKIIDAKHQARRIRAEERAKIRAEIDAMKKDIPVPIEAVLSSIAKVLNENIGKRFDLEITERNCEGYSSHLTHRIEINLTIEEPIEKEPKPPAKPELKDEEIPF